MKKADVLQLAIVLMGVVFGFVALQYLFTTLYGVFVWIFYSGLGADAYYGSPITNFAVIGLEVISSWLLITKSGDLAAFIYKKSNLGTGFKIISNPHDLLYILLIAIGVYILLVNISPLLTAVFESFRQRVPHGVSGLFEDERPVNLVKLVLDITVPLLVLMFAKPIADYFAKNINDEPITIEESFTTADSAKDNP